MTGRQSLQYDAIVIGAGHNGLVAAVMLARAGRRAVVVEKGEELGGAAAGYELAPGFRAPRYAHLLPTLPPRLERELDLAAQGLAYARRELPTVALSEDGGHVVVEGGRARLLSGAAHPDAQAFHALHARLCRFAGALAGKLLETPPRLERPDWRELTGLAKLGLDIRRLGAEDTREFLRVLLSNAYDVVLDEIAEGPLAAVLALEAVMGGHNGPRSPGTALALLYRLAQGGGRHLPQGGVGAFCAALGRAAEAAGAEIRRRAAVASIAAENDRVAGVVLVGGERITAPLVLSSLDAQATLRLTGAEHFDAEAVRRIRQVRCKGVTAKVNLALSALPEVRGIDRDALAGRLVLAPSVQMLESAFDPCKHGELPMRPPLEIVVPSLSDPTLAPQGGQVMSIIVQYAPYHLKGGWTEAARERLGGIVLDRLEEFAPGLGALIVAQDVLTPDDIERETGAAGGHWHHGELAADQMLSLRPVNGMARYRLPVGGLYLCGAAAHPGGDLIGAAGRNAAREALREVRAA
ncbi:MAG: phytoene desaturase family protein [Bacteroidota bacterium]|nr:NAD(P)/FAD-dependent oxidoreductase [Kiloniellaceae bacterium]